MRVGYRVGIGVVVLFLIWFFYALTVYEELSIFLPIIVGLISIPCFALYFLLVFLYGKYSFLRKPILYISILPPVILVLFNVITNPHFIANSVEFFDDYVIHDTTPELPDSLLKHAELMIIGETVNLKMKKYNEERVEENNFYSKSYRNILEWRIEKDGQLTINFSIHKMMGVRDSHTVLMFYGDNQEKFGDEIQMDPTAKHKVKLNVEEGDSFYIKMLSFSDNNQPIKDAPVIKITSKMNN